MYICMCGEVKLRKQRLVLVQWKGTYIWESQFHKFELNFVDNEKLIKILFQGMV